jgi:hypothetical protein
MQLTSIPLKKEYLMLELQNDAIYELVIDNSYFIFIGNDSFNEEIDYFRELRVQQPFSIITDSDNKYSKLGEVLLSADTKSNKDTFINDVIERTSKVDNVFIFSDMSTDEVAKETANICELSKDKQTILIIKPNAILDENISTNISKHANITILSQIRDKSFNIFKVTYLAISHIMNSLRDTEEEHIFGILSYGSAKGYLSGIKSCVQAIERLEPSYCEKLQELSLMLSVGDDVSFKEVENAFKFPANMLECNGSIIIDAEKNPQSTSLDVLALAFAG